ncbi:hypothetical protein [Novosphingobium sp.]|uniref:hypothetical protein n=1 Tax=Novosphingobium sp. TaxID=1874826 RepID=UPI0031DB82B4
MRTDAVGPDDASIFGQGLTQLGQALQQTQEEDYRTRRQVGEINFSTQKVIQEKQRTAQYNVGMGAYADLQISMSKDLDDLYKSLPEGKIGYGAQAQKLIHDRTGTFLDTIKDDQVRERFAHMVNDYTVRQTLGANAQEEAAFTKFQGDAGQHWLNSTGNGLIASPTSDGYHMAIADLETYAKSSFSDEAVRQHFVRIGTNQLTGNLLDGMSQAGNWQGMRKLLGDGVFKDILTPQQTEGYLNLAGQGENIAQREAALATATAQKNARDVLKSIKVDIDNGTSVPHTTIAHAITAAKAAGLPESELKEAGYLGRDSMQAQQIRGLATPVLDGQVMQLRQKQAMGKLTDDDAAWLTRGEQEIDKRSKDAGLKLAPLLKGDVASQMQGMATLASLPVDERFRVARAAGHEQAAIIAGLPEASRLTAVQGASIRQARPTDFLPPKSPDVHDPHKRADEIFRSVLGDLVDDVGSNYAQIRELSLDFNAGSNNKWDEAGFRNSIQVLSGQRKRSDGVMVGGIATIHGHQIELPAHWTASDFDQRYARNTFAGAIYANGSAVKPEDVRAHFRPQHLGTDEDGTEKYLLIGANRKPLLRKGSGGTEPYVLSVSAYPR